MTATVVHPYVVRDPEVLEGEPVIQGTKTPVRAIVELWRSGILPEEIPVHLPHITLAQVFDALSYYAEHQDEVNHYIEVNCFSQFYNFISLRQPLIKRRCSATRKTHTGRIIIAPVLVGAQSRPFFRCYYGLWFPATIL